MKKILKDKNTYIFFAAWLVVVLISFLPYIKRGLPGNLIDLLYQMERIEGLKDSFSEGIIVPRIYSRFFYGYGYGSPLFYSDFFFVVPACLRLAGLPAVKVWKLFVLLIVSANYFVSFFSYKKIFKSFEGALLATVMILLSQYYLMDLSLRVGLGEYIATIFLPVLMAGIYDYFEEEGRNTWLLGIAFSGMLLSHTIMVFLGAIFTILIFVAAFISRKYRKEVFVWKKISKLLVTALMTLGVTSFYFLPMIEQMLSGKFAYNTPWVHLSDFLPEFATIFKLKGTMFFVCEGGIGLAVWLLVVCGIACYVMTFRGTKKNSVGLFFTVFGVILFGCMTKIFPWKIYDNTILNNLQFTFRILPYALVFAVCGSVMMWNRSRNTAVKSAIFYLLIVVAIVFGFYQNTGVAHEEITYSFDDRFLSEDGTVYVGKGEWLPQVLGGEAFMAELSIKPDFPECAKYAEADGSKIFVSKDGKNRYSIIVDEESNIRMPLIYYKGYKAYIYEDDGHSEPLTVSSNEGFVNISNSNCLAGKIVVSYENTVVQTASMIISLISLILTAILIICGKKKNERV